MNDIQNYSNLINNDLNNLDIPFGYSYQDSNYNYFDNLNNLNNSNIEQTGGTNFFFDYSKSITNILPENILDNFINSISLNYINNNKHKKNTKKNLKNKLNNIKKTKKNKKNKK